MYTYTYMYVYMYIYILICRQRVLHHLEHKMYVYIYTYMYVYIHLYVCIYAYRYTYMSVWMYRCCTPYKKKNQPPNCPCSLSPHANTWPSAVSASTCLKFWKVSQLVHGACEATKESTFQNVRLATLATDTSIRNCEKFWEILRSQPIRIWGI